MEHKKEELVLPASVSGYMEVARVLREIDSIDDHMLQLKLRNSGTEVKLPKTTLTLDKIANENKLNLLHETDRKKLQKFLSLVKEHAPVIHISFSSDPSPIFIEKITLWLRKEIHPQILLTIGLQPTIGAGCVVRTTNRFFDFSLSQNFLAKKNLLLQRLIAVEKQPIQKPQIQNGAPS
jgi:hypothetical protein